VSADAVRRRCGGFTLLELLVVVAIIGIVVTVAVGQYQRSIRKAKEAVLKEDLYIMRQAIDQYFADKGEWPPDLQALVEESYLRDIPVDPITESAQTWVTEPAQVDDRDISTSPGIADVHSGADGVAMDGSSYSEW
jgi:general secretion pathway protein G